MKSKMTAEGVKSCKKAGKLTNTCSKQVQRNLFISYMLSRQLWWCNIKQLLSYFKNYTCKYMQVNS